VHGNAFHSGLVPVVCAGLDLCPLFHFHLRCGQSRPI
jgi:hypothetical protein